jgi:hypothetical protein
VKLRITLESKDDISNEQNLSKETLLKLAWAKAKAESKGEDFEVIDVAFTNDEPPRSYHDCHVKEYGALVKAMDDYGLAVWKQARQGEV